MHRIGIPGSGGSRKPDETNATPVTRIYQRPEENTKAFVVSAVHPVTGCGNLRAVADVEFPGLGTIRGWRVVQQPGQRAWVSVPQQQGRDGRWYNMLQLESKLFGEEITRAVLAAWESGNAAG